MSLESVFFSPLIRPDDADEDAASSLPHFSHSATMLSTLTAGPVQHSLGIFVWTMHEFASQDQEA